MSIMPTKPLEAVPFVTEPWRKCLLEAAERIRVRGHAKGVYCDSQGRNCAVGAIYDAQNILDLPSYILPFSEDKKLAHLALLRATNGTPALWNDAPERTAEEVIETMITVALSPASEV